MRAHGLKGLLFATTAVVIAMVPGVSLATGTDLRQPRDVRAWMPDVVERVASLRERNGRAAAEAETRSADDARSGQWRHAVAAPPAGHLL